MVKYIDKAALVAEIEKRIKEIDEIGTYLSPKGVLTNLLCYLSTLKGKEVDLEKEINLWVEDNTCRGYCSANIHETAEHFFELGIKAQTMTSKLQQRIGILKMGFGTGLQTFEETEMTLSDAYNQGVDDILEELGLKTQKGEEV